MKNLKKLSRNDLKKTVGGVIIQAPIGGACGNICQSHADCGAFGSCGVCVTTAVGLSGRCTGY